MALTTLRHIVYFVGIDISKSKIDCWLRPLGDHLCTGNDQQGFKQLRQWLTQQGCSPDDTVICMENTGIYGKSLLLALHNQGWKCSVEKTTILEKVGPEHHRKDDPFDARLLAEYADRFTDQLNVKEPAGPALDSLRQLMAERGRLVRQRSATKTKQAQATQQPHCPEVLQEGWQKQITFFDGQIGALEEQITQIIESHKGLHSYFELITDIPGVGPAGGMVVANDVLRAAKAGSKESSFPAWRCSAQQQFRQLCSGKNALVRTWGSQYESHPQYGSSIGEYT